jgi:hypothetical protein
LILEINMAFNTPSVRVATPDATTVLAAFLAAMAIAALVIAWKASRLAAYIVRVLRRIDCEWPSDAPANGPRKVLCTDTIVKHVVAAGADASAAAGKKRPRLFQ